MVGKGRVRPQRGATHICRVTCGGPGSAGRCWSLSELHMGKGRVQS